MVARISARFAGNDYTHLWRTMGSFADNPMGVHWTGIVFGLGWVISFGYWTTDFLVVQRVLAAHDMRSAQLAPIIGAGIQDDGAVHRDPAGPARARPAAGDPGWGRPGDRDGRAQLQRGAPADAGAVLRARPARARDHRADCRLHVGHGWKRERLRHRVDIRHLPAVCEDAAHRRPFRPRGALVHDPGGHGQHRDRLPGQTVPQHHGLRTGALQLLHRAPFRHRAAGDAVAAGHTRRRFLGTACGNGVVGRDVALGENGPRRLSPTSPCRETPATWRRTCTAGSGRGLSA